jgi:hypothetical protein
VSVQEVALLAHIAAPFWLQKLGGCVQVGIVGCQRYALSPSWTSGSLDPVRNEPCQTFAAHPAGCGAVAQAWLGAPRSDAVPLPPTQALHSCYLRLHCFVHCCVQDEVLSHRLGLVPLAVDPNALAWRSGEDAAGEANTVVFKLAVRCSRAADGSMVNDKGETQA